MPFLASLEKSNVSMMEWVIGPEGQRQAGLATCAGLVFLEGSCADSRGR